LNTLQETLASIKSQFPDNDAVMVVPDDDVAYDDIVHVLERVKLAKYSKISLTSAARSMQVASVNPGGR
jgi:biopolymer transport protein ExbD